MKQRVILAEDHPMTRMGLKLMLENDPDFELVAEARTGQEALDAINAQHAEQRPPSLVLMDIGMPDMDGIEATQKLKQQWPHLPVLMLTSKDNANEVKAAMAAGADGYCLKGLEFDQLKPVMQTVAEGNAWLDRHIARVILMDLQPASQLLPQAVTTAMASVTAAVPAMLKPANCPLTDRELEVLRLVVDGLNNQQISDKLYISIATTKAHIHSMLQKLCLDDRTQAAVWAMRQGLAG
jgi:two-component system, NarL family, response regulator LiaR